MYFDSFSDFLAMGQHGLYVWTAYGFFALVLVWNLVFARVASRRALNTARRYWQRHQSEIHTGEEHETY